MGWCVKALFERWPEREGRSRFGVRGAFVYSGPMMSVMMIFLCPIAVLTLGSSAVVAPRPPSPQQDAGQHPSGAVEGFAELATTAAGQLPPDTDPAARSLWESLLGAAFGEGPVEAVRAFDLEFDGRIYQDRQTNDFGGRYQYLHPDYVRTQLSKSKRVTMRGPEGDWLIFENGRRVKLVGIDYEVDIEELDRSIGVAQSFVALTDPRTLHIARLERMPAAPPTIPPSLGKRVGELDWLALDTPDFRLEDEPRNAFSQPAPTAVLHRIELGLDRQTHLPALAVIRRADDDPRSFESARLLWLDNFRKLGDDAHLVPHKVITFASKPKSVPPTFESRQPAFELFVKGGTLQPRLGPDDFVPPPEQR